VKNITSHKYFIPGFAVAVTLLVVLVLVLRGGVPGDAVAVVKGDAISKAEFNKTLGIFVSQSHGPGAGKPVLPDPPNFTKCIADKRRTAPKKTSAADLKKSCETEYNTAKQQIMTALIQRRWFTLEAKDRGINISDSEVKQRFVSLKQQAFPKEADYKKFLGTTGQSEADLLLLVKNQIIQEKIREQITKSGQPTAKDIEAAYNKNKQQYAQPASRALLVVFNSKKAKANAALAALRAGDSFAAVAKKYSQDSASKGQGGKMPVVTKGQFEPSLDKAVFGAPKGKLVGPIKTQFGYYVFEVTKSTAAKQQSLQQATPQIKQTLVAQSQQKAFDTFQKEFTKKWKDKTHCADGYVVDLCKNAPKKKGPTAAAGTPTG
jgi:foldase protein PrsA